MSQLATGQLSDEAFRTAVRTVARARIDADARQRRSGGYAGALATHRVAGMVELLVALGVPEDALVEAVDEHYLSLREL